MENFNINNRVWKDIPGFEGMYQVSNDGKVKSLKRTVIYNNGVVTNYKEKILKPDLNKGYHRVTLSKGNEAKRFLVHRIVALCFIKNEHNKPHINHIDGNKINNTVSNLEWCTPKENENHSYKVLKKRALKGEEKNQSKLSEDDVIKIRRMYSSGMTCKEISYLFNVSRRHINDIVLGNRWGWLEDGA